jgi:hypothetical protein
VLRIAQLSTEQQSVGYHRRHQQQPSHQVYLDRHGITGDQLWRLIIELAEALDTSHRQW